MHRITEQFRVLLRRSACKRRLAVAVFGIAVFGVASVLASAARATAPKPLVVCSDPDNMPFSNTKGEGFENRLAVIVAAQLGRPLAYDWLPQRPDLVREELAAGQCDVVIGVPTQSDWLKPTASRSSAALSMPWSMVISTSPRYGDRSPAILSSVNR